jgi:hypothetical protein
MLADSLGWRVPLILGIHGASGEGKTYQCEKVLGDLGVRSLLISGGQLEGPDAGQPAMLIRNTYIKASRYIEENPNSTAVILINDFDTGVGNWGELVQTTVNRQTVFGELMHLVDYPNEVQGVKTHRVPIIFTGNDFTKLYVPLVRAGRMTSFEWIPTAEERTHILRPMLGLSAEETLTLTSELGDYANTTNAVGVLSTAFFAHLKSTVIDDRLSRVVDRIGAKEVIRRVRTGEKPELNFTATYEHLLLAGKALIDSGHFINHLKQG